MDMIDADTESCLVSIITVSSSFMILGDEISTVDSYLSSSSESENGSESDSDEETDMSTIYAIIIVGNTRGTNIPSEKLFDYIKRVVPGYSRQEFKEHFR